MWKQKVQVAFSVIVKFQTSQRFVSGCSCEAANINNLISLLFEGVAILLRVCKWEIRESIKLNHATKSTVIAKSGSVMYYYKCCVRRTNGAASESSSIWCSTCESVNVSKYGTLCALYLTKHLKGWRGQSNYFQIHTYITKLNMNALWIAVNTFLTCRETS